MSKPSKAELRARIIRRLRKMAAELEQIVIDKEWWNNERLDAPPFDVGWDRCMLQVTRESIAAWERNDIDEVKRLGAKMDELAEAAR